MNRQQQWIEPPKKLSLGVPYVKARLVKPLDHDQLQFQLKTDRGTYNITIPAQCSFDAGQYKEYEDMCEMDVLNEPEVLSNLVRRYCQDRIFTCIGPTLITLNPNRFIDKLFGNQVIEKARINTLKGKSSQSEPHVYKLAGQAFEAICSKKGKQAIVISGESGAGKTQSTKYCVKLLTALSPRKFHSIQQKILAANPVLQAFGNSKTARNENSSRFGKFMSIFFDFDGHILGARIQSYLLQKSRVVTLSKNERNFHAFYALTASGKWNIRSPQNYHLLKQSNCFSSTHIDDSKYFNQINEAFTQIGFKSKQIDRVWSILAAILELGNIQFDDTNHLADQSKPCTLVGVKQLGKIALLLGCESSQLQKLLLFEKRKFLKEFTFMAYGKASCKANLEALCKGLYNSLFEFILKGVQANLKPDKPTIQGLQISILDIFGFQNFEENSFEQFCINFANERLLRLYNDYVFRKEMQILREDGLQKQIVGLVPPSNDSLISMISGKLSLFSIINDMTLPQFKDQDIIVGFRKLQSSQVIFNQLKPNLFMLSHSPCSVTYSIEGFKPKNQDKIHQDISDLIQKLWGPSKQTSGKTILTKFNKQIDDLMTELQTSQVHFIRCIKPNQLKQPKCPDQKYILTQVRYLGVLQTIFIRKNTFPCRYTYQNFKKQFCIVFKQLYKKGNDSQTVDIILSKLADKKGEYLLGRVRIYMISELQLKIRKLLLEQIKIREEKAIIIQKNLKACWFRIKTLKCLHILNQRLKKFKIFPAKIEKKMKEKAFVMMKEYSEKIRQKAERQAEELRLQKLKQAKQIREQEKQKHKEKEKSSFASDLNESQMNLNQSNVKSESFGALKEAMFNFPERERSIRPNNNNLSLLLNQTDIVSNNPIDSRAPYKKPQTPSALIMGKMLTFNEEFRNLMEQNSQAQLFNSSIVFQKEIDVGPFKGSSSNLLKLKEILSQKFKLEIKGNEQDFFSPVSIHCKFKVADLPSALFNQIIDFNIQNYFNGILRKRTTFFGSAKTYTQILVHKKGPLTKSMTMMENEQDEKRALIIFNTILKIGDEEQITLVLKYVERLLDECQNSSLQFKREIMVQMIRQANTSYQLSAIRIYQLMAVYLHVYNPQLQLLKATLHIFYWKLKSKNISKTQSSYLTYLFSSIVKKLQKRIAIGYLPSSYQIMGLMCKRQISIPIYLPAGTSILINVESFNTFMDIKEKCIREFGISQRLSSDLFGFFQVVNFQNEDLEESPIRQTNSIWDMITYWELTKQKYNEGGINPPTFFILLKIRFAVVIRQEDEELCELCFSQLYFDYFMNRINLEAHLIFILGALIYKIRYESKDLRQMVMGLLPLNFAKTLKKKQAIDRLDVAIQELDTIKLTQKEMKFKFTTICSKSEIAMAVQIPVQQNFHLFLKPRYLILHHTQEEKTNQYETISLKRLIRWQISKQSLELEVSRIGMQTENKIYLIKTDSASIFNQLLRSLSNLKLAKHEPELPSFKKK